MAMSLLGTSARVWLFQLKHQQGERGKLSLNVMRVICEYLADYSLLAHVNKAFLRFFDFETSTWSPKVELGTTIVADLESRWVVLDHERVFCCGYGKAYIISRDGSVEQKAKMIEVRWGLGLLHANNAMYAFGGFESNTCEQFKLPGDQWNLLPSMKEARGGFNPCMFLGIAYLSGHGSEIMEAFAPQTDTFLPLSIQLPQSSTCCLYVDNHLLVVHLKGFILKFAVGPDGQVVKQSEVASSPFGKVQNSHPIVNKARGLVYMISYGACVSFNMETGVEGPSVE